MGSPSSMGRGLRGSQSARSHPQRTWDSFLWVSRGTTIGPEVASSSRDELGVVADTSGRNTLEVAPSPGPKSRRRGRPKKKIWEGEGDRPKAEPKVRPACEESVMPTDRSQLVETADKGGKRGKGRSKSSGSSVGNSAQQLEQAQIAIAELYQENRELRRQLVEKTQGISPPQGRGGSVVWLQRQLREAQDTIVELRDTQRMAVTMEHKSPQSVKDKLRQDHRIGDA
jgi:hypothetical protein